MSLTYCAAPARGAIPPRIAAACRGLAVVIGGSVLAGALGTVLAALIVSGVVRPACAQPPADGAAAEIPAGLFFRAGRDDVAFEAPTLKSDVRIAVNGLIARVTVRQHFLNPSNAWMEGIYVFPLPERSAVDRLSLLVGGRRVEGRIMERAEARRTYEKAATEGRRASLLSSERANVFTTSVANVGPGEEIVVEIQYQDTVAYEDGRFALRFPMVVAPRYTPPGSAPLAAAPAPVPQPAAAGRPEGRDIFGPVRHPDDGPGNALTLVVTLDAGLPLAGLQSLYHPVDVEALDARRRVITLADGPVPADRDFVLEWTPAVGAAPEAAVFAEEVAGNAYLLVMLVPPAKAAAEAPAAPRELVFVVDTSGSMSGPSIDQAKKAMMLALRRLGPADRFNVIRFASDTHILFPGARPASPGNLHLAEAYVRAFKAEGGTNMLPALVRALRAPAHQDVLRQVVFLTDGAVGNEPELFETVAGLLRDSRLFTVGIGSAPNSYFMRKAAELGRGTFTYIGKVDEVAERMAALLRKLEHPALTNIAADWQVPGGATPEPYPAPLPDLYAGEPVVFTAQLPGVPLAALSGEIAVAGMRGAEAWRRRLSLSNVERAPGVAAVWARAKIDRIEDGQFRGEDPGAVRAAALEVALAHRLITRYTSLVAVDETVVRPPEAGLERREIPRNLPAGWSWEHVFGEGGAQIKMRGLPPSLLRKVNAVDAAGNPVALPQTATPASLKAIVGSVLLVLGAFLLLVWLRARRGGPAGA